MAKLTSYNLKVWLVVTIAAFSWGFGASIFATSSGQPGFYDYFGLDPTSRHTANILSAINACFFGGCALGALAQCYASDWVGRRGAFAISACLTLLGAALVAGSVQIAELFMFRVVQGIGSGMILGLVPLYLTEVAPPKHRGLMAGSTQFAGGCGYIVNSFASIGCYHSTNLSLSWRLPLACACIGPLGLLAGLFFIPESPRYLVWRGKQEKAYDILKLLHHDPKAPSEADAQAEFTQIIRQVELDKEDQATLVVMFQKPSWRRRSISVMILLFMQQAAGTYGITNYFPLLIQSLGMTADLALWLFCVYSVVATLGIGAFILVLDRYGRRLLLLIGFATVPCILLAEALLQWKYQGTTSTGGNGTCVLFIFLFIIFFQAIDAPTFVWMAEVFPTAIRAKGVSLGLFAYFVGTVTFSTPAAVALQSIKWGMFLIYAGLCVVSLIGVYFFLPETKGIPVEEIGALFGDTVAVYLTEDGTNIIEDKSSAYHVELTTVEQKAEEKV
ncbi:uncharacterized protein Z520_11386 [Fonsecaea multimorphosa CBS 102226]|uniref:Major facilitator superfamily (MFS) profile domain-containing protein n=1 Tax=Fonsecaea multimorphosa CBS 102226 TaxID=1442371 RepID=A0A0D2GTY2_9EURO|nr:uncharacterized protein Z520_11386 [Fonsecaea multimorphosa CBS 102226]KIX92910.1 hypothetical protein Z520_11386 [Fonsecaea multimorphosa CBS 102226]